LQPKIEWNEDNGIISIFSDISNPYQIQIKTFNEIVLDSNINGNIQYKAIDLFRKVQDKNSLALYATKNNLNLPLNIVTNSEKDTTFNYHIEPMQEIPQNSKIKGVCAPLALKSSNLNLKKDLKSWLFGKREYMNDSEIDTMSGIIKRLIDSNYEDYVTSSNIPVLHALSDLSYEVTTDMKADYYILYACTSNPDVDSFVRDVVTNDFKAAETSVHKRLRCYSTSSSGFKCISLIGIMKNWSYKIVPLGLVAIDNVAPGQGDLPNICEIDFKDNIRVFLPNNKPEIAGYARVISTNYGGNGISCNVSFSIEFGGDAKTVTIVREFEDEFAKRFKTYSDYPRPEKKIINLSGKKSPYEFTYKIHLEEGDNLIPIIVTDNLGNTNHYQVNVPSHFSRDNSPDVNIDNNIDINN
jgi:hypothetical protein